MTVLFGLLAGTLNLLNPEAVHIPFGKDANGVPQSAEGTDGLIAATLSAGVLGLLFGGIAAFLAWISAAGIKKAGRGSSK